MSNYQFKVGDKVYVPRISTKVFTLKKNTSEGYPIKIEHIDSTVYSFTLKGLLHKEDKVPSIFLATRENKLLLDELYHMEFDEPITKDSIIQNNIDTKGFCLCIASDYEINKINNIKYLKQTLEVITEIISDKEYQYTSNGTYWKYAEPIELKSDGTVIYLADD